MSDIQKAKDALKNVQTMVTAALRAMDLDHANRYKDAHFYVTTALPYFVTADATLVRLAGLAK